MIYLAEFCLDCMNETLDEHKKLTEKDVVLEWDLCEGCGKWKPCVIAIEKRDLWGLLIDFFGWAKF